MSNPVHDIARSIVTQAIDSGAFAIQIELGGDQMAVDHHSEGAWHRHMTLPAHIFPPVTTRYKEWADVDLLNRRYPLKGQFPLIHKWRHYTLDVTWEDPRHDPRVRLTILAGAEAEVEDDDPHLL